MVFLRAAHGACILARSQHRFLDAGAGLVPFWPPRNGSQFYNNDFMYALPWDDSGENAAARVAKPDRGRDGYFRDITPHGGTDHAFDRSVSRRALLRHPGRGFSSSLDALFLDFRSPGSLHPDRP